MRRSLLGALALTGLLLVYVAAVAGRGLALVRTGEPVGVVLGVAVLILPVLGVWVIVSEWHLAVTVQQMADRLAADGALPVDDLPRTPAGRVDRAGADEAFTVARAAVDAAPGEWAAWFRLGFAYDAARDRRRAREALRTATRLYRG